MVTSQSALSRARRQVAFQRFGDRGDNLFVERRIVVEQRQLHTPEIDHEGLSCDCNRGTASWPSSAVKPFPARLHSRDSRGISQTCVAGAPRA